MWVSFTLACNFISKRKFIVQLFKVLFGVTITFCIKNKMSHLISFNLNPLNALSTRRTSIFFYNVNQSINCWFVLGMLCSCCCIMYVCFWSPLKTRCCICNKLNLIELNNIVNVHLISQRPKWCLQMLCFVWLTIQTPIILNLS